MSTPKMASQQELEAILARKYKGRICCFSYPGKDDEYGMVDEISIDITQHEPMCVIQMNFKRFTCSIDSIQDCITTLS